MRLLSSILVFTMVLVSPLKALAECDFATGITKVEGGYLYTTECHKKVGKVVADLKDREEQVAKLNETIKLKDLALDFSDKRNTKLMETVTKMDDKLDSIDRYNSTSKWLHFGLGVVVTGLAVWGAGQLR